MLNESNKKIWTVFDKKEEKLLRSRVADFDFSRHSQKDIDELIRFMRFMMIHYRGVGLSANQIGLDMNVFVCQLPTADGKGYQGKFYSFFNPKITKTFGKKVADAEGCLSVPGYYGDTARYEQVTLEAYDKKGKPVTIKAQGYLARIFQHETDHLRGVLYIDSAKNIVQTHSHES